MRKQRSAVDGFNIAFLDVMACGLGAIILIFMLVDFQSYNEVPTEELDKLTQELAAEEDQITALQKAMEEINDLLGLTQSEQAQTQAAITATKTQQEATLKALAEQQAIVADLADQLAAMAPVPTPSDNLDLSGTSEQNYLLGLKVEGRSIGILVDKSASMMAPKLIDIFKLKGKSDVAKQASAKWQRTLRIVTWLLSRTPKTSDVTALAFSDNTVNLGVNKTVKANAENDMRSIVKDLEQIVPDGGTNLAEGLKALRTANPSLTDIYVITDGLPTLGGSKGGAALRGCKSLFGSSNTISGACRAKLFVETIKSQPSVKTHVILLPLEGDPEAAPAYWAWAKSTGGIMIAPAGDWPR